jgi:peptidoglycan-N-acetylglucosamine deacetylase
MRRRLSHRVRKSRLAFRLNQRRLRYETRRRRPRHVLRAGRDRHDRAIALSYDDGPSPENTPELLEMLGAVGARATFFVVGSQAVRHPELLARIAGAGHEVGNHSYSHANPRDLDDEALRSEILRGAHAIAESGAPQTLFRPPFGKRPQAAARICQDAGFSCVLWSVDSGDTMPFSAARIAREVVDRVEPGDIVLMHDGGERRQRTLDATRMILDELQNRGYRFVTVSELFGDEPRSAATPPAVQTDRMTSD